MGRDQPRNHFSLLLKKYVFREHFASYKCAASNSLGRGSAEVLLTGGCRSFTSSGAALLFFQTFVFYFLCFHQLINIFWLLFIVQNVFLVILSNFRQCYLCFMTGYLNRLQCDLIFLSVLKVLNWPPL